MELENIPENESDSILKTVDYWFDSDKEDIKYYTNRRNFSLSKSNSCTELFHSLRDIFYTNYRKANDTEYFIKKEIEVYSEYEIPNNRKENLGYL